MTEEKDSGNNLPQQAPRLENGFLDFPAVKKDKVTEAKTQIARIRINIITMGRIVSRHGEIPTYPLTGERFLETPARYIETDPRPNKGYKVGVDMESYRLDKRSRPRINIYKKGEPRPNRDPALPNQEVYLSLDDQDNIRLEVDPEIFPEAREFEKSNMRIDTTAERILSDLITNYKHSVRLKGPLAALGPKTQAFLVTFTANVLKATQDCINQLPPGSLPEGRSD